MINIHWVNTSLKKDVERFLKIPYRIFHKHSQWVPPLFTDARMYLDRKRHPFYEHSDAEFMIAERNGHDVGRIAVLENRRFNDYHNVQKAQFYFFECENDLEAATTLFDAACTWARERKLTNIFGPKGMGPLDGYGVLVDGYEHRQMMTMMNYNFPYYSELIEAQGFTKEVDFVSCYLHANTFKMPERVHSIAKRILNRDAFNVIRFQNRRELRRWAEQIGNAYNKAFVNNWEYSPLTENEIEFVLKNIIPFANPKLIKVISHKEQIVGFLFAFPDISAALQRANGNLNLLSLIDLMIEMKRTKWIALNGAGILPEYHGRGGNALLYTEMENTMQEFNFVHADLTQVAETAVQMRKDLENVGGFAYKNHRVYSKDL